MFSRIEPCSGNRLRSSRVNRINALTDTFICQGNLVSLSVPYSPQYTYQWNLNWMPLPGASGATLEAAEEGLYRVIVRNNNCSDTTQPLKISYKPGLPKPALEAYGPNAWYFICSIDYARAYRWYYNGTQVAENDKYVYYAGNNLGEYYVAVNDTGECYVPSETMVIPLNATGTDNLYSGNQVCIYPNPTNGTIRIFYSDAYLGKITARICNIEGVTIKLLELYKNNVVLNEEMDLSDLKTGLYIFEIYTEQVSLKTSVVIFE